MQRQITFAVQRADGAEDDVDRLPPGRPAGPRKLPSRHGIESPAFARARIRARPAAVSSGIAGASVLMIMPGHKPSRDAAKIDHGRAAEIEQTGPRGDTVFNLGRVRVLVLTASA